MHEWLFHATPEGLEPRLGTGWDVSEDGLTVDLFLREGVTWHDGEPFTAEDVVYTFMMYTSPDKEPIGHLRYGSTIENFFAYNEGEAEWEDVGIEAVDDHTVRFTLTAPDASMPKLLFPYGHMGIVPKHILEGLDQDAVRDGTAEYWYTSPVGTGPYKFVEYRTDQYIMYERYDDHWAGLPGPDQLIMKIASPETAVVMLETGEIDFINTLQLTEVERLQETEGVDVLMAENSAQWYGLEMNYYASDGLWRNPKAKQAMLYSIDRQAYVDSILQGFGTVRHSFYDGTPYACPDLTEYNYDPEKAEELWNEIGLDREARGEITIDFMSWLGLKARMDYLPIAQEYLRQMGFKVNVDIIDNALITDYRTGEGPRGREWDFHVLLFGPGADPASVEPFMMLGSQNWGYRSWPFAVDPETGEKPNPYYYENERVIELLNMARVESDPEKRTEYFQEIDCIWNEELPALMTASPMFVAAKSNRMQGVDWQMGAGQKEWTRMYKPEEWWIWEGE
jgi:peptide/nickel transport system substrate-binding protein